MARQRAQIDWAAVDRCCRIQCTGEEIASLLCVNYDTLNAACKRDHGRPISDYIAEKSQDGRRSLRRKQFQLALKGDRVMLIWLGKQYLGQRDKLEETGADGGPKEIVIRHDRNINTASASRAD